VIAEVARSGLFSVESTDGMLVLARDMRAHNLYVREATSLEPHMDRVWACGLQRQAEFGTGGVLQAVSALRTGGKDGTAFGGEHRRGLQRGARRPPLRSRASRDDIPADVRLDERRWQSSVEHGDRAGGDCHKVGEGEQREEARRGAADD
jgi:hypothetical protein